MAYSGLDTYLNDHMAGATAGCNLAQMASEEHQADEHGPFFSEIYAEISADKDTLQQLMDALGVEESSSKTALAEVGSFDSATRPFHIRVATGPDAGRAPRRERPCLPVTACRPPPRVWASPSPS